MATKAEKELAAKVKALEERVKALESAPRTVHYITYQAPYWSGPGYWHPYPNSGGTYFTYTATGTGSTTCYLNETPPVQP